MRRLRAVLPVLIAIVATWGITTSTTAQSSIPNGVFVQERSGTTWLILDGKRVAVPLWPSLDQEIGLIPRANQWAVLNDGGTIVAGSQPSWCGDWAPCYVRVDPPNRPADAFRRKRVGETFSLVGLSEQTRGYRAALTVNTADLDAAPRERSPNPNLKIAAFDITVRNEGSVTVEFSVLDFKLQTTEGYLYEREYTSARTPDLDDDDLGPGQSSRGWLTFQIPRAQTPASVIFQQYGSQQWVIADLSPQG